MKNTLLTLSAIGCLTGALDAAQGPTKPALERALAAFRQGDADGDGKLSAREARAIGISEETLQRFDDDDDASVARDEFLLYYHDLLVQSGQPAGAELEGEVGRIQAIRRARDARRQERERAAQVAQRPADARAAEARADVKAAEAEGAAAQGETPQPDAGAAMAAAFDRLEERIKDGVATREDYEGLRAEVRRIEQGWIARARRAARQGDQAAQQSGVEQANAGTALLAAIDDLERKASAGQIVDDAELGTLKNRLIARARQASRPDGQADAAGDAPAARAARARGELAGRAQADPLTTEAALGAALDRLEQRVLNGEARRDEFQALRERLIARARNGAAEGDAEPEAIPSGSMRLVGALDELEQKYLTGTVSRADLKAFRELAIRSAREASGADGADGAANAAAAPSVRAQRAREQLAEERQAEAGVQQAAAPRPATRLTLALAQLEERALGGEATPDDYQKLRAIFIQRARQAANGEGEPADGITAERARELQRTLDALEARSATARLTAQDFGELRRMLDEAEAATRASGARAQDAGGNARKVEVDAARGDARRIGPSRSVRPPQEAPAAGRTGANGGNARGDASQGTGTPPAPPPQGRGQNGSQGGGRGGGR